MTYPPSDSQKRICNVVGQVRGGDGKVERLQRKKCIFPRPTKRVILLHFDSHNCVRHERSQVLWATGTTHEAKNLKVRSFVFWKTKNLITMSNLEGGQEDNFFCFNARKIWLQ